MAGGTRRDVDLERKDVQPFRRAEWAFALVNDARPKAR
jgi:hypothetical protein